ncbi:MAG: prephenate dehydrogenase [Clostridiales bacterium]|nr:prephenate dehydrogenase [Clostridiales bacterium]
MNIAVVGLGLIGGSIAKCIKKLTPHTVLGMDVSEQVMYKARLLDAIDLELTAERLAICDMVIVATWPKTAVSYVEQNAALIKKGAIVIDVCGVKTAICEPLWKIADENGFLFVGGHPMAGIEYSGFDHALATLFQNASMILTPPKGTDIQTLDFLKHFWRELGFGRVVITTPENHDQVIAYTSQLAHVVSSAYVLSPSAMEHHGFSAGSFKDMTRVAKLNEDMWTELFFCNREPLLSELDIFMENLQKYRDALAASDEEAMRVLLRTGREHKEEANRKDDEP